MPIRIAYALLVGIYLLIVTQNGGQVAVIFEQTPLFWQGLIAIVIALLTGCCIQLVQTPQPRWRFFEDQLLFTIPALLLTQRLLGWSFAGIVMLLIVAGLSIRLARTIEHRTIPSFLLSTVVGGTLLVAVALHICLRLYPVEFSRQLGVLNLVVLFLSIITLLIACALRRPKIGVPVLLAAVSAFVWNELSHDIVRKDQKLADDGQHEAVALQRAFARWLLSRNDLGEYVAAKKPYPVVLVASEGGGGYAAAHAFLFLSKLQERCPNFAQHTFALVGVSGGAVGNTQFQASLNGDENKATASGCRHITQNEDLIKAIRGDHLSPVLGAFLFQDAPNKILLGALGTYDRARALALSLTSGLVRAGHKPPLEYLAHYWDTAKKPAWQLNDRPALVHVATDIVSGMRFIFAPFEFGNESPGSRRYEEAIRILRINKKDPAEIQFIDTAVASASFPWITPSLRLNVEKGKYINLVDGGYLDNSGAETVTDILADVININLDGHGMPQTEVSMPQSHPRQARDNQCERFTYRYIGPIRSVNEQNREKFISLREDLIRANDAIRLLRSKLTKDALAKLNERASEVDDNVPIEEGPIQYDSCTLSYTVHVIIIRSKMPGLCFAKGQNFLLDPVSALLNTRQRRGETARYRLLSALCGKPICRYPINGSANDWQYYESVIDPTFMTLPLGWDIPPRALERIFRNVAPQEGDKLNLPKGLEQMQLEATQNSNKNEKTDAHCEPINVDYLSPFFEMKDNFSNTMLITDIFKPPTPAK